MNNMTIIASAVVLALGVNACSEQKSFEQSLASANEYSQKRQYQSAIVELKNAVRKSPKSAEARLALGKVYLTQGNFIFAEKELEKAVSLGISLSKSAPFIAKTKAKLSEFEDLQALVEKSTQLNDDEYIQVLVYAGMGALTHNKHGKAQDYFKQAISIKESSAYGQLSQAYLAQLNQDYSQSLVAVNKALAQIPNLSAAMLLKGQLQFSLKDYEQAANTFTKYIEQTPLDYPANYFKINSLIKAESFKEAEKLTNSLLKKFESDHLALHFKALLDYQKKNYKEATNNAEQAIQAGSSLPLTKIIAGVSAYHLKDYEQSYNYLKPIESLLPDDHLVHKIIAVVKFQLGYSSQAIESLVALEGLTTQDAAYLQSSASSLVDLGDFDNAQKLISKAKEVSPDNANILVQSGLVSIAQNNTEDAIQSLTKAIELDPTMLEAELALGVQYLKTGEENAAKNIAKKLMDDHQDNPSGFILQGIIYTKENSIDNAIEMFNKALLISPNNIAGLYNLGLLFKAQPDFKKAMHYFEQVINLAPSHKGALTNYVAIAANNKQLDQSAKFLKDVLNNDTIEITMALAQNLRLSGLNQEAISLLEGFPKKESAGSGYWSLLGDLYIQLQNIDQASRAYNEGLKTEPQDYVLNLRSIGMYEVLQNYPQALSQAKSAYGYYPDNARLEILLAYFELRNGNIDQAKKMLSIVKNKHIEHHLIDSVSGRMAVLTKDFEQAVESFSAAFEKKASEENVIQLSRALKFNGQQSEAEKILEAFIKNNTENVKVRYLLAELYTQKDIYKKIEQYQWIKNTFSENVSALNNLAWYQYKNNQINAASINAQKAYQLAPDNLAIIETYGVILAADGDFNQAIKVLNEAIEKGSNDPLVIESLEKAKSAIN